MSDEIQSNLFKEYSTFDHLKNSNSRGVGLGLNICVTLSNLIGPKFENG